MKHAVATNAAREAPRPRAWPIVGMLPEFSRRGPIAVYSDCWRRYGDLFRVQLGHRRGHLGDVVGLADHRRLEPARRAAALAIAGGEHEGNAALRERLGHRRHRQAVQVGVQHGGVDGLAEQRHGLLQLVGRAHHGGAGL